MDADRREQLEVIMAGLAAGDRAMVLALVDHFGDELRRTLVALSVEAGLDRPAPGDLPGLVFEAAAEVARVAGAWRPDGGALPWVWARGRLLRLLRAAAAPNAVLVADLVVERADTGAEAGGAAAWAGEEPPAVVVLSLVARRHPGAALVAEALALAVRPADHELLLRHADQVGAGDPSPAATLAREVGRSPDAVRQAVSRGRRNLRRLAEADERFRPLLRLPLLGAVAEAAA